MSFMVVIDKFHEISKQKNVSQEVKDYASAMKKIFIGIEQANVNLEKFQNDFLGRKEIVN